jgi:LAO/AO transport system kinase
MTPRRAKELAGSLLAGDKRALSRLITLVENREPGVEIALAEVYSRTGRAHLIGITGPPGAGKSTSPTSSSSKPAPPGKKWG